MGPYPVLPTDGRADGMEVARVVNATRRGHLNIAVMFEVTTEDTTLVLEDALLTADAIVVLPVGSRVASYAHMSEGKASVNLAPGPAGVQVLLVFGGG